MQYQIFNLDCRDVMSLYLEDNSVDAIVTDPPYGLSFMGKDWDHGVPGIEFWKEMLRVLKPGGYLLSFGGSRTYHRMASAVEDAGFEIRDQIMWVYGSGFPKSLNGHWGGTALKPAHEPLVLARKPLIGTVAANVLAHGTGGLNIDECRVETTDDLNGGAYSNGSKDLSAASSWPTWCHRIKNTSKDLSAASSYATGVNAGVFVQPSGRWPANLIHDGSDEVVSCFPRSDSPWIGNPNVGKKGGATFGGTAQKVETKPEYRDVGSAARFFYAAKASKKDREDGNTHPTVKPTDLMAYLCRLVTPAGGVVLDPFMGSGSTGKAAIKEGFRFIGAEREAAYYAIAEARLKAAAV